MTFGASQTEEINVGIAIKANDISITFIAASIGITAKAAWKKYNKLRPDHDTYVKNLKIKEKLEQLKITNIQKH